METFYSIKDLKRLGAQQRTRHPPIVDSAFAGLLKALEEREPAPTGRIANDR